MKLIVSIFFIICCFESSIIAQNIFDARQSVIMQAVVQESPAQIKLNWVLDTANGGYTIWRKSSLDQVWVDSMVHLAPNSTSWIDTNVHQGIAYEYQILKSLPAFPYGDGSANFGAGYIYAGNKIPPKHQSGACLMVIDQSFKYTLAFEISRLLDDLQSDGWVADTIFVNRNDSVFQVKKRILDWANKNPNIHQALFLFGRIPVPYSGEIAPDGHHSDHRGSWPCDGFYGTIDGLWTDQIVKTTAAASSRNDNVPGDGKFDNNIYPAKVHLQIGRVDFSNMNKFSETEEQLLRRYLNKNHNWRIGKITMLDRGLVDNNFPSDIEGLGQSGWKNFAPMFGITNVKDLPYRQTLSNQSFLWSYGCGGGGPESASDISSTTYFTTDSLQSMFTMLFGSYFGDWDYPNNFLRGAIASKTCLASTWGNRPNWFLHHMALGASIGYSTQITMNNRGLYTPRFYGGYVSTALMGDPTLRMHVIPPVENLNAKPEGLNIRLDWKKPKDATGFYIYRKYTTDSDYTLLNDFVTNDTFFIDACRDKGLIHYMVRATSLKNTGSGSYYILSAGVTTSILSDTSSLNIKAQITSSHSGQTNGSIKIIPSGGCAPYSYKWSTGETTSELSNLSPGTYCLTVSDCMNCTRVYCSTVNITTSISDLDQIISYKLFPNPTNNKLNVQLKFAEFQKLQLTITDINGIKLATKQSFGKDINLNWDVEFLSSGYYWLHIENGLKHVTIPFTKTR